MNTSIFFKNGLVLAAAFLGFLAVLPFKSEVKHGSNVADPRQEALIQLFEASENERKSLQEEVDELRLEVTEYQADALSGKSSLDMIQEKLNSIENLAGLTSVQGPGIEITLSDANRQVIDIGPESFDRSALVIHDQDLMLLINELKAAGAEAISIKSGEVEERVVASTFVRCTGPTLIVNNKKMASPFTVRAIGDSDILAASLEIPDGLLDQLRRFGIQIRLSKVKSLTIPGYTGSRVLSYAQPDAMNDSEVDTR
jgi:uncharacterized protein YlxW (UPF0749 family)